mgnify:CR=1 FL=1
MSSNLAHGVISVRSLSKRYGGVQALDDLNLDLERNIVHAIVGENGAGKSTLIKILSGALHKDSGSIIIENKQVEISDPKAARNMGIETIYQDLALAGNLDVASNFFLGNEKTKFFFLRNKFMEEESKRVLQELRISIKSVRCSRKHGHEQMKEVG